MKTILTTKEFLTSVAQSDVLKSISGVQKHGKTAFLKTIDLAGFVAKGTEFFKSEQCTKLFKLNGEKKPSFQVFTEKVYGLNVKYVYRLLQLNDALLSDATLLDKYTNESKFFGLLDFLAWYKKSLTVQTSESNESNESDESDESDESNETAEIKESTIFIRVGEHSLKMTIDSHNRIIKGDVKSFQEMLTVLQSIELVKN